jgi:putative DNA primase/helicase
MAKEKFGRFELEPLPDPIVTGNIIVPSTTVLMCQLLQNNLHFAKDQGGKLYVFENGVYRTVEDDIYRCCMAVYSKYRLSWSSRKDNEVDNYLGKTSQLLLLKPDVDKINFKNGLYFIYEDRFEPHSEVDHSWYKTTIQIPITYDPSATCPKVDKFMQDVFPEGYELLYDAIGICMTSVTAHHTAIILLGKGSNGKSIYLYGLRAMIGFSNCSATPMHVLADHNNRFANNDIVGKLANVSDDTRQEKILETNNVKSIISGNPISVEAKFRTSVTYKPFCKLVFASNHRLTSSDDTLGFVRRIMHIPLDRTFAKDPKKEVELQAMWDDPQEQSGVFNKIRERLAKTCEEGFIIPEGAETLVNSYDPISQDIEQWLRINVGEDVNSKISCREFYCVFWVCAETSISRERVGRYLAQLFPTITKSRPRVNGIQTPHFMGIRFISDEAILMQSRVMTEEEEKRSLVQ